MLQASRMASAHACESSIKSVPTGIEDGPRPNWDKPLNNLLTLLTKIARPSKKSDAAGSATRFLNPNSVACWMVCFTRNEPEVREYLRRREGEGFVFPVLPVRLRDGNDVHAWVGIYAGKNVMPVSPGGEKATMVKMRRERTAPVRITFGRLRVYFLRWALRTQSYRNCGQP